MEKKFQIMPDKYIAVPSKFGFFEVFNDENIKKGFHSINNHTLDKKYEDKIALPILETILVDNGQFIHWNFTDKQGYVLRKSSKNLTKEYIMLHLINLLTSYFYQKEGIKYKKTDVQILSDLHRITLLIDQNFSKDKLLTEPELKYLEKLIYHKFILLYLNVNEFAEPNLVDLFNFNKTVGESNMISLISIIQINLFFMKNVKPLICRYIKKADLAPKKIEILIDDFTLNEKFDKDKKSEKIIRSSNNSAPLSSQSTMANHHNDEDTNRIKDLNKLSNVKDSNLADYFDSILEPFIKLIEKSKHISIREGHFKIIKIRDILENSQNENNKKIKSLSDHYVVCLCTKILVERGVGNLNLQIIKKMEKIKKKGLPEELINCNKKIKHYEKISIDANCFGEFCEFSIPKIFKNLKKSTRIYEINSTKIPVGNKISERDKMHNLPNCLPVFLIKKTYDNPNLVNIVLKAYSIFPKNFDKDTALREMNRLKMEGEERRKEKENEMYKKFEQDKNRLQNEIQLPTINTLNTASTFEIEENKKCSYAITLYIPTPLKFERLNIDSIYSKRFVCSNCFIIYNLIQNFLNNIDETTSQFKSLSKAKDLLFQGDDSKNPYEKEESINQEQPDNLLFQEERNDFNLKTILMKNLVKIEKERRNNKIKKREKLKLYKKLENKKEEFKKTFSYIMNANPKLLKLNLLAEKTKNKFFNLIFNELRTEPESIYTKLGINKPEKLFKKSMNNLRMHMGINSNNYNITPLELNNMNEDTTNENLQTNPSRSKSRENEIERETAIRQKIKSKNINAGQIKSFRKILNSKDSLLNATVENKQTDIDLFSSYKYLKKGNENNVQNLKIKESKGNENFEKIEKLISRFDYLLEEDNDDDTISDLESEFEEKEDDENMESFDDENMLHYEKGLFKKEEKNEMYENLDQNKVNEINYHKEFDNQTDEIKDTNPSPNQLNTENLIADHPRNNFQINNASNNQISSNQGNTALSNSHHIHSSHNNHHHIFANDSRKIVVSSIYYYDRVKEQKKFDNTSSLYYYITSPLTKINEINLIAYENPLLFTRNMNCDDFIKIGKFDFTGIFDKCQIFVYDQFTAVPYKIVILKNFEPVIKEKKVSSYISKLREKMESKKVNVPNLRNHKIKKCFVIVLNDFFESFLKYENHITEVLKDYLETADKLKIIYFNFPGQSSTLFSTNFIFNNIYYAEFLDKFLYFLNEKNEFDHNYNIILVGFGNGGHVALTYASLYEKYWDFIHSILLFNSYCGNDEFIDKSMLEILKIVESGKNARLVDFFVKSISIDPQKLIEIDKKFEINNKSIYRRPSIFIGSNEMNPMCISGYHNITKGYFYNIDINHKELQTPMVIVHSNQNCFITLNNINNLISYKEINSTSNGLIITKKEEVCSNRRSDYNPSKIDEGNFDEILPQNKFRRKLIVIDGSHDVIYDHPQYVKSIFDSYIKFINKKMPIGGNNK